MYRKNLKTKNEQKILYFFTLYVSFLGKLHVDSNLLCTLYDINTVHLETCCCEPGLS